MEVTVCTQIAGSGKAYMDLGTAMEFIVVIMSTYIDHVARLPLEEELLDVPENQGVAIEEWATYFFDKKVHGYSARSLACVSYVNSVGSSVS